MSEALHPAAPHHLPGFITAPGDSDVVMIGVGIFLIAAVLGVGNLYLHLHAPPERMAHRTHKLQFEIVAVLGLLALFTHNHLFWVIGLFLEPEPVVARLTQMGIRCFGSQLAGPRAL